MGRLPETSLIITAHRHGHMLEKCLDAVAALDPAPGEAIVVVDGNDQALAQSVQRCGFETIVLPNAPSVTAFLRAGGSGYASRYV